MSPARAAAKSGFQSAALAQRILEHERAELAAGAADSRSKILLVPMETLYGQPS
jgi:hypothetical protein